MIFSLFKKLNNLFFIFCLIFACSSRVALAQETTRVNPLINNNFEHELLPRIDRDLTPLEIKRVQERIEELNQLALAQLADDSDQAFTLWYEGINLSRSLGLEAELDMIKKVGALAWEKSRGQDLTFLQARLSVLEQENKEGDQLKPDLLPLFIEAYDSLHALEQLIVLNQQSLSWAEANNEPQQIHDSLKRLGELYLAKFDYYQAEPIYQRLLEIAREQEDYLAESLYLQKLAEISQALVNPENSVRYKEELAQIYQQNNNLVPLSRLQIAIGNDYLALKNAQAASDSYQSAFSLALSLEQYAIAGDALKQLGKLYQQYGELDAAIKIYRELIKIESNSYNFYGLMNTYDFMGTIYTLQENYDQALIYFQRALSIARELDYKEDYFVQKINQIHTLNSEQ